MKFATHSPIIQQMSASGAFSMMIETHLTVTRKQRQSSSSFGCCVFPRTPLVQFNHMASISFVVVVAVAVAFCLSCLVFNIHSAKTHKQPDPLVSLLMDKRVLLQFS